MKKILLTSVILLSIITLNAQTEFITTWKTDNPGTSNSSSIIIPTFPGETYNYDVDWNNDGVYNLVDIGKTGSVTHDFGTPGTYTIRIRGTFPRIYFNGSGSTGLGDSRKLISIDQWGTISWTSMEYAFSGCYNLQVNANDAPNLSGVTSLEGMFLGNFINLNQNFNNWDTSTITNMSRMFTDAHSFNGNISNWDTSNVTNMSSMFTNAFAFNQNLNWDTGKVVNMQGMFSNASSFNGDISSWDTSSVTNMTLMFSQASNPSSFNQNLGGWNVENVTELSGMFNGVTLSDANYEALLIGWNSQNLQPNLNFDGGNSQYCTQAAADARANMIASDGWTITDGGACSALSTENIDLESVSLYPNPSSSKIAIKGLTEIAKISIFDISGKQVFSARNHNNEVINITNFKPGYYLVKIQNSKGSKTIKILVD
ncbi:BspA family leucine-rich repeat surface protein [Polaribacter sp. BAL334]|uniref:BspA family leucine-rich repeat surface protein n=1 Tax=Polaribacter sp. BAL334 TaxID=1708178 RepID=UPI0018D1FBBA|nr:BspA family leucine-rich repeat surface protein [Polaribacter sp. BAL334]MBG7611645.1 BspA family leucine-rich repeat surface protein [Polaribacter sp. BAL334]